MPGLDQRPYAAAYAKSVTTSAIGLTDAAIGLTTANLSEAESAVIYVEGQPVRYSTVQGVDPTTSSGPVLAVGSTTTIRGGAAIRALKLIATTSTATVHITLHRW
jgi:hypothetical protein